MDDHRSANASAPSSLMEKLPATFNVKYLGFREAKGLWGIKHTRGPVESMAMSVKESNSALNTMKLIVTADGCRLESIYKGKIENRFFPIESISYGVQDLVYARIFSMIVVKRTTDFPDQSPFQCHAFICECKLTAKKLTRSLAAAFHRYSLKVKNFTDEALTSKQIQINKRRFAVDLRSAEELQNDLSRTEDSEA